ncbi:alpha/beta fold hydrolase [Solirubrobacter soli]|uniref:alpha/beta fold hydrolase n=1 Tax=Solirubrobacter soli TaxID=363832 RepID=UPI000402F297|nr:alpha/beta fold hydrolase [Solirubrobacter soli]
MKTSVVEVGGLRLRVGRAGDGPPLLLITGIGANLDMWRPLEGRLGERELIAFDAPGVGGSQRPRLPLRMGDVARIVRELMDVLGLERPDVLGYSWGGALAQELTRRSPERVRRLVLCATGPGLGGVPPKPLAALALATPARYYHPRLLELTVPLIAGGRTARDRSVLIGNAQARLSRPPDVLGYAYQLYAAAGWTSLPWLHRIEHPVLVVGGDDDPAVPVTNARMLAKRLPNARLHVVRGGGHLFLLDQPEDAAPEIAAFLL